MMKPGNQLFVATLAATMMMLCGALAGCGARHQPLVSPELTVTAATLPSPHAPLAVEVFEVSRAAPPEQLIPAVISSDRLALVLAQREGALVRLHTQEGARVKKGDELARINEDDLQAQLRQVNLDVDRLLIEEQQYEALVKVNRVELEQEQALLTDGLVSQRQLDQAQYKLEGARSELDKTRLATRSARARVEAVRVELEKCVVRAPISGVVTHAYARLGSNIVRNDKLFEVAPTAPLEVRFQLPQSEAGVIRVGSIVSFSLPGDDRVVARVPISRIDPVADAASNSIGYRAEVAGSTGLWIGMAVNVRLAQPPAAAVIWIPLVAFPGRIVPPRGSSQPILVREGARCAARTVTVREIEGDQVSIGAGLMPGDQVILAPLAELKSGDPVETKKP